MSIDISIRSRRSRPIGASIVPVRAGGCPSTSARYSRRSAASRQQRLQRAMDRVVLGDDQQPGGVAIEPMDDPRPPRLLAAGGPPLERLGERPGPVTARGMHDHPGRLVDDQQVLVLVGDAEVRALVHRCDRRRPPSGTIVDLDRLAGLDEVALGRERAVDEHAAGVDQRLRSRARAERLRQEPVEPRARRRVGHQQLDPCAGAHRHRRAPFEHAQQRQHAERDRHVGDVERRPVRQLDEVGHRAVDDPVDQVAERAADQHPGRQPQQRPVGRMARYPTSTASAASVNTSTSAPPPDEQPERDAGVADVHELDAGRNLCVIADARCPT